MSFAVRPIGLVKSAFVFRQTISSDATNYNLRNAAIAAGWDGVAPLDAEVTVSSGIVLSADSTGTYGFDTGASFPAGTTLTLIMPGYVCGMGGSGGPSSGDGYAGGPAMRAQYAIAVDATGGVIAGGGGGGGGGGGDASGGGGRSGRINAPGGGGFFPGAAGTFASGGKGGNGGGAGGTTGPGGAGSAFTGGGGGGWGAAGGNAGTKSGGAGGAAVVGNSYITWVNTGTRYGAIA